MNMKLFLALTKDDNLVFNRKKCHMALHPVPMDVLEEALSRITVGNEDFLVKEVTFERPIGVTTCVRTTNEDNVIFAQRINRNGLMRFVTGREPVACNSLVIVLKRIELNVFVLITAFVGKRGTVTPDDWSAHEASACPQSSYGASVEYWSNHALVYDKDIIVPGSETIHPWSW